MYMQVNLDLYLVRIIAALEGKIVSQTKYQKSLHGKGL